MTIQTKEELKKAIAQKIYDIHKTNGLESYSDDKRDWAMAEKIIAFLEDIEPRNWERQQQFEDYRELGFVDMYDSWLSYSISIGGEI